MGGLWRGRVRHMGKEINEFYAFGHVAADRTTLYVTVAILLFFVALTAVMIFREIRKRQ